MDGILLVDKPVGWTSHDVVAKVRNTIKSQTGQRVKVGHTGTLDPKASGLMVLVMGKYTKRASEFSKLDKAYEAQRTLGANSSTGDSEGEITQIGTSMPTIAVLQAVLSQFEGKILQTPPIYSAVKIDGQRAYKMARKGQTPVIEPREVTIYSLALIDYTYPTVKFTVSVSSGTYIRSLAVDIGEKLGTGAYLSALRRTQVGQYDIKDSQKLDLIDITAIEESLRTIDKQ
jgi:tRNA pseudouridine55 synthase